MREKPGTRIPANQYLLSLTLFFSLAFLKIMPLSAGSNPAGLQGIAPVALCRNIVVQLNASGNTSVTGSDINAGSYDPDGQIVSMTANPGTFTCASLGQNSVTLTVVDNTGLSSTCTATVTVIDRISPAVTCKNITIDLDNTGKSRINPADVINTSSDNCNGTLNFSLSRSTFSCSDTGTPVPVTVTATDASGNSSSCTATITVRDILPPVINLNPFNLVLGPDGTGTLLPSDIDNGTYDNCSPVTLSVSPDTFTCSDVGDHTVTLTATDARGNSASSTITVTVTSSLQILSAELNSCYLTMPFALFSAEIDGGDGTYSYFWKGVDPATKPFLIIIQDPPALIPSNTSTSPMPFFNNATIPDGIYDILLVVTDGNGCRDTSGLTIQKTGTNFNNITYDYSESCNGEVASYAVEYHNAATYDWTVTNGTILNADRDTSRISVLWDLAASQGIVTATIQKDDYIGTCQSTVVETVTLNPVPVPAFEGLSPQACGNSLSTYTLSDTYSSYSWDITGGRITAGGTSADNYVTVLWNSIPQGRVEVTVTNESGCPGSLAADIQIFNIAATVSDITNITCNGEPAGAVTVTAVAGTGLPPYEYSLDAGPFQSSGTFTGLSAGNHIVTVRDDLSCTSEAVFIITQPQVMTASVTGIKDVSCFEGSDGNVTVSASGGLPPYVYSIDGGPFGASNVFTGLEMGSYIITVRDQNSCETVVPATVIQPPFPLAASATATDVLCHGESTGSISLTISGGTAPYSYSWNNGAVTEDLNNIPAGDYDVTVTDANGCTATAAATVTEPDEALEAAVSVTDVLCNGDDTGSAGLTVTGGTEPYTYLWSDGSITEDLSGVEAGSYTVTVTDANGCTITVTALVSEPAVLSGSVDTEDVLCYGDLTGTVSVTVTGGTAPYVYQWNTGATTPDLEDLAAGTYTVTVTDANMCELILTAVVTQPDEALAASATATDVLCHGESTGSISLTISGGTAPYSYSWNNGAVTEDLNNIPAGDYDVTVTDANGCTATAAATVTEPDEALEAAVSVTDVLCNGDDTGSAGLTVTGGTEPYTYLWSDGSITEDLSGVEAGSYTVTVTDANGCTITVTALVSEPAVLSGSVDTEDVLCYGDLTGTVSVTVTGGTAPYVYQWNTGATTPDLEDLAAGTYTVTITDANLCELVVSAEVGGPSEATGADVVSLNDVTEWGGNDGSFTVEGTGGTAPYQYRIGTGEFGPSGTFGSLSMGTYPVTVRDVNLCTFELTVTINQPDEELVARLVSRTDVLCNGEASGSVTVEGWGGTIPFEYSIDGGEFVESGTFGSLAAGTYLVTVRDAEMSTADIEITIAEPEIITIDITKSDNLCYGGSDGSADVLVSGGTGPYGYSWDTSPVQETATATGLAAGTFRVTVTDANGCMAEEEVVIGQPENDFIISVSGVDVQCNGSSDGSVTATVSGDSGPYTFAWNTIPVVTTPDVENLRAGTYTVTVTDSKGCFKSVSVVVEEPDEIVIGYVVTNASCPEENDGAIDLNVTGGTSPYTVLWSDNSSLVDRNLLLPGSYSVVVTDQNSCAGSADIEVGVTGSFSCIEINQVITPNDDGYNDDWKMKNIELYPDAEVLVYNRWGRLVFRTKNPAANRWDGRLEDGSLVPTDSYHYILYLNDGSGPRSGVISVIR